MAKIPETATRTPGTAPRAAGTTPETPDAVEPDRGTSRRSLLRLALAAPAVGALATPALAALGSACNGAGASPRPAAPPQPTGGGPFVLPELPYGAQALAPHLSGRTLGFHHGKHHRAYLDNLNAAVRGTPREKLGLLELIRQVAGKPEHQGLFNNAAQVWNHSFYWQSMTPKGGGEPKGPLAERLGRDLGGVTAAKRALAQAALGQFGSGWAWLVRDGERLKVMATPNAALPLGAGQRPLLCIDVWEHAYYLDWQNRRGDYVQAFLDHLVSWRFAEANLSAT